jgi:hypothetical protein
MTTPTKTRRKPASKATAAGAEADTMHAEAMAAPLGLPLSPDALAALERESPGGPMTIIAAVRESYDACKTVTKGDCEALLEQWHGEAREAVYGPLAAWLGAGKPDHVPAPAAGIERDEPPAPEESQPRPYAHLPPDPFDASFGPRRDDAVQADALASLDRWSKGGTSQFPAITDEPAGEPEAAEPALSPPAAPPAAVDAAEDWDALKALGDAIPDDDAPHTETMTVIIDRADGDEAA